MVNAVVSYVVWSGPGVDEEADVGGSFVLSQNYPNPFTKYTTISYELPTKGNVSLKVYDLTGSIVKTLVNSSQRIGSYNVSWDGKNEIGRKMPAGIYFYRLETEDLNITKKLTLLR